MKSNRESKTQDQEENKKWWENLFWSLIYNSVKWRGKWKEEVYRDGGDDKRRPSRTN